MQQSQQQAMAQEQSSESIFGQIGDGISSLFQGVEQVGAQIVGGVEQAGTAVWDGLKWVGNEVANGAQWVEGEVNAVTANNVAGSISNNDSNQYLSPPSAPNIDWIDYVGQKWDAAGNPTAARLDYYSWDDASGTDVLAGSTQVPSQMLAAAVAAGQSEDQIAAAFESGDSWNSNVGTWIDAPAKLVIVNPDGGMVSGANGGPHGSFTGFKYQLEDIFGNPLTGPGYSLEENVTNPDGTPIDPANVQTSNNMFQPMDNGTSIDAVGWGKVSADYTTVYSVPVPQNNADGTPVDNLYYQGFTVKYDGTPYPLTTVLEHENFALDGVADIIEFS